MWTIKTQQEQLSLVEGMIKQRQLTISEKTGFINYAHGATAVTEAVHLQVASQAGCSKEDVTTVLNNVGPIRESLAELEEIKSKKEKKQAAKMRKRMDRVVQSDSEEIIASIDDE